MDDLSALLLGWLIAMVGIWHPYVVDVGPEAAASIGALLGATAAVVVFLG